MFSKLFSRARTPEPALTAQLPEGQRIYAIGDIHGRCDLTEMLLAQIQADDEARGGSPAMIIFLGDLVDRGPESAQVVALLMDLAKARPAGSTRFLLGNHEEVFLAALSGDIKALKFFDKIGGRETILSYGVSPDEYRAASYDELMAMVQARVPGEHADFIREFEDMIIAGDYVFVHAGIRPGEPLDRQRAADLRWIREEFISFAGSHEKLVVHGHTITDAVEMSPQRIGIDTGAYQSGVLSAVGFEGGERWILQARGTNEAA